MARREGENEVLDVASLVLQSVKAAYDVWKKEKVSSLGLTDEAKHVLETMQSDETGNGIFIDATTFGTNKLELLGVYTRVPISTTRRVITELEAKGIVTITENDRKGRREQRVTLTHFGWILNPDTGQVDKIG